MLANVSQAGGGFTARFERDVKHPVKVVWAWLTDNDKLSRWFSELRVDDLRERGLILFDMGDGTFEEMKILALEPEAVLEYTWGEDRVRFELIPKADGCRLVLIEKIHQITDHTPKDLAGWHVCLEVVQALMDGRSPEPRKPAWEHWYEQYAEELRRFR